MPTPSDSAAERRRDRASRGMASTRQQREARTDRLPKPPRERRPLLAAFAVLLIVGGALLAGMLAMRADERVDVVVAARTIAAGQSITAEDLTTTPVSATVSGLVPADSASTIIGSRARTEISAGQLVDTSQIATGTIPGEGQHVAGVLLEQGRYPAAGLSAGDTVNIVDTDTGAVLVEGAQVLTAGPAQSTGKEQDLSSGLSVSLIVPATQDTKVVTSSAKKTVALILTAPGQPIGAS
ncbi:SAF domain protein [Actinomyces sp. Chiba101]|uniref:SAF domain-containing protein n=1 Tax=Actinomyces TaxID=1654 RepID=UPI000974DED6|nr:MULTISPECIES: SAF domain-containing protein [Actinomyces]BAW94111.1 SAF domain protein [Actinomyces sp. Chiba101]GAV95329.1 hypothetical protein ADENT20671_2113 [Actinomyces denticolens]SUU13805.1 flagellar basal body P-ring biosynthesis protein FlgA [Actinomyces denticolens]